MNTAFNLWRAIHPRKSMSTVDLRNTERALRSLGHNRNQRGRTARSYEAAIVDGIRQFQRRQGLDPDGIINPDGPTHRRMQEMLGGDADQATRRHVPIVAGEHDDLQRLSSPARRTLLDARRDRGHEAPQAGPEIPGAATSDRPNSGGTTSPTGNETSTQVAWAAPAARFFTWLMERYGLPTIAAAMAMYNSWSKNRQKAANDDYVREGPSKYDYCHERVQEELDRCGSRKRMWQHGCKERAWERFKLCYENDGSPHPDEPDEWGPEDEEVSPPR